MCTRGQRQENTSLSAINIRTCLESWEVGPSLRQNLMFSISSDKDVYLSYSKWK